MSSGPLLVVLVLACSLLSARCAPNRPHIVFILADDLGWNDVGFTGNSDLQTPNIDTLAYSGRILSHYYAQPTCTPSRAALLTGKYPIRTGMQGYPLSPSEPRALPLDHKTLPEYLKDLGYQTHLVGKWHLGYYDWKFTPLARGFDTHFGYMNGFVGYYDHYMNAKNMSGHDFWRGTQQQKHLKGRYMTDLLTEETERLIEAAAENENPIFLLLSHLAVHSGNPGKDHEYPEDDIKRFSYIKDENRSKYAAMVWNLDKSVGRVVKALAKNDLLDNTLIVVTSDNGAQTRGLYANDGSNYPLRGLKFTMFEGGIRTVAAVWNAQIHGQEYASLTSLFHVTDWLPTLYEAAGGDLTDLSGMDGKSQLTSIANDGENDSQYNLRSEILLNVDERLGLSGIRYKNWKYLNGSYLNGSYEDHFGDYRNELYTYSMADLAKSEVAKDLKTKFPSLPVNNKAHVSEIRRENTIQCDKKDVRSKCNLVEGPCLFNLHLDPCEQENLYSEEQDIAIILQAKLDTYRSQITPQLNTVDDPAGNPKLHNDSWMPWRGGSICRRDQCPRSAATTFFSSKLCFAGVIGIF
ncbi:Hypothetical predicted protein [Cloeon dipterum]|uniref:Sulfatase N-terminal domain-containing protein n=1 Tax=Cloeon dipterum TaxID=197152 RepID=A0A8S1DT58_9INSE|nr:Hypothetical predicted protein [Cloeon dipterum]